MLSVTSLICSCFDLPCKRNVLGSKSGKIVFVAVSTERLSSGRCMLKWSVQAGLGMPIGFLAQCQPLRILSPTNICLYDCDHVINVRRNRWVWKCDAANEHVLRNHSIAQTMGSYASMRCLQVQYIRFILSTCGIRFGHNHTRGMCIGRNERFFEYIGRLIVVDQALMLFDFVRILQRTRERT